MAIYGRKERVVRLVEKIELDQNWNGYCPESYLKGQNVKKRLNKYDFFESEATSLQICVLKGVQAVILNFRGAKEFKQTPVYGHEIEQDELFSPQNIDKAPFNNPTEMFDDSKQIEQYILKIK